MDRFVAEQCAARLVTLGLADDPAAAGRELRALSRREMAGVTAALLAMFVSFIQATAEQTDASSDELWRGCALTMAEDDQ